MNLFVQLEINKWKFRIKHCKCYIKKWLRKYGR